MLFSLSRKAAAHFTATLFSGRGKKNNVTWLKSTLIDGRAGRVAFVFVCSMEESDNLLITFRVTVLTQVDKRRPLND